MREATTADIDAGVDVLTQAFENYPMTRTVLDPDGYLRRLSAYNRIFLADIGIPHGRVWVTADVSAVAIWSTPATPRETFAQRKDAFDELAGSRAPLVAEYEQAMGLFRPSTPVWFLAILGVNPTHQRQGLARAVLTESLAAVDRDHSAAFLETQDPVNVAFYESLGFTVSAEMQLPHDGPMYYAMHRRPVT